MRVAELEVIYLSDILDVAVLVLQWSINIAVVLLMLTRPWAG